MLRAIKILGGIAIAVVAAVALYADPLGLAGRVPAMLLPAGARIAAAMRWPLS